jgi:hypothetical protein
MTWCIGIVKIRTTNILCWWSSIVCLTRSGEKKTWEKWRGAKKCQFNPLICDSLIFTNGTLKLDPKGTHCTLPKKKKKFCEERSNSRIQFVSNILKLVLEILDLGPSSKMTLRIEAWNCSKTIRRLYKISHIPVPWNFKLLELVRGCTQKRKLISPWMKAATLAGISSIV